VPFKLNGQAKGSVLLGARSLSELNRLTNELMDNPNAICGSPARQCAAFPEACSVSLEIEIVVNGQLKTTSWGSTLASVAPHPQKLALSRLDSGRSIPVEINGTDP
jgi:hypothetical protein